MAAQRSRQIVLLRLEGPVAEDLVPDAPRLPVPFAEVLVEAGFTVADVALHREVDAPAALAYLHPAPAAASVGDDSFERLRDVLARRLPQARATRLQALMEIDGAAAGAPSPWHYVVETDVQPQADADLNAWYDREHLPGLAAVPGTVRAARYRSLDDGPRYHACYDLAAREVFGSAPWLAVRATDWSSRVRPMFVNTRRTMLRTVLSPAGAVARLGMPS